MYKLQNTKTESNLRAAFAGESQARNKYTFYASRARAEGYPNIARYWEDSAMNEQEHAKLWFHYLRGIGSTADNLKASIEGEEREAGEMYPVFAKIAREEGLEDIAVRFEQVGSIEKTHEEQFRKLLANLEKSGPVPDAWKCDNCGNIINAKAAPASCPVCGNADIGWSGYKAYKPCND